MKTYICYLMMFFIVTLICCNEAELNITDKSEITDPEEVSGVITIGGSYALYPLVAEWAKAFQQVYPNIKVSVQKGPISNIYEEINQKSLDLVMASRDMEDSNLWYVCVSKMGVVPIMCSENPYAKRLMEKGLTHEQLIRVFTSDKITWNDLLDNQSPEMVNTYIREDYSGTQNVWKNFLWANDDELKGLVKSGDDEMIAAIREDPFGIGFCNLIYAFDPATGNPAEKIQVILLDLNYNGSIDFKEQGYNNLKEYQRAICIGKYPKSLCRSLQLVALNKPVDPVIRTFIKWVLTDGQEIVGKAGYVKLNNRTLKCSLKYMD